MALKILHPSAKSVASGEARARGWLEARVAASDSPSGGGGDLHDLDEEAPPGGDGAGCAEGGPLRERVTRGPIPVGEALARAAAELCATLEAVHRRGIAHGDVKPGQFAAAQQKCRRRSGAGRLRPGARLVGNRNGNSNGDADGEKGAQGTLAYMAPEAAAGDAHASRAICTPPASSSSSFWPERRRWPVGSAIAQAADARRGALPGRHALPEAVVATLGAARAAKLRELAMAMMAVDPTARPSAAAAALALTTLTTL